MKVFGRRPDGYHNVRSVMVPVTLYDEVTVEEAPSGIRVETDDPAVPTDGTNSCARAAAGFMEWAGCPSGVRIRIVKRIPREAGLGGGSSDAAATLKGLSVLTGRAVPPDVLLSLAARVGADVPFFAFGRPALVEGLGELLSPVEWKVPFAALIVKPSFGCPTREGYERLRRRNGAPPPRRTVPAFRGWDDVVSEVANDFEAGWEEARPEIAAIKEELLSAGARAAGLSGSGSAVFGLFQDAEGALRARGNLPRNDGRAVYVARNI